MREREKARYAKEHGTIRIREARCSFYSPGTVILTRPYGYSSTFPNLRDLVDYLRFQTVASPPSPRSGNLTA